MITPLTRPNTYSWYAMVSKFSPEVRASWPKAKAPQAAKSAEKAAPAKDVGKGRNDKKNDDKKKGGDKKQ